MPLDVETATRNTDRRRRLAAAPVVIEARDVEKTFRVPLHKVDTFKERALHPLRKNAYRELHAVRGVSFDVRRGEFFGIVGRNGSGKSTLLKLMSSIYRADVGRIRLAGRVAPFIELGVGFNMELTSRENIVLNGVMMGLTRREAHRRLDAVLDFAELSRFADLKLKNYSSGMLVRLAFSVMVEADADIMLVDEVLAVGDASFSQKCMDVFHEKRQAGKTLVLVTHDMPTVQGSCDRAMVLHAGACEFVGDTEEAALRYYRRNFRGAADTNGQLTALPDVNVRIVDAALEEPDGARAQNVEQYAPLSLSVVMEARQELIDPVFGFHVLTPDGAPVFAFDHVLDPDEDGEVATISPGQLVRIRASVENRLTPGRYFVQAWVWRNRREGNLALQAVQLLDFVVYGTDTSPGYITVDAEVDVSVDDRRSPAP